jgi:LDH2 family malate/lactate/ureidoglycolate dehydrogenase
MYVHGERELETEAERRANGIPLHAQVVASLEALTPEIGVPFPEALS